ncbi:glutamine--tRNA ligase/YqeY domain fusion protein [soil metagenome]
MIDADIAAGRWGLGAAPGARKVHTRFPPEPNGYLHIGHAKSICINAGLARDFGGKFNLRFDDTNPAKEEQEYVDAIKADVKWLGGDFDAAPVGGGVFWASDYFEQMYAWAVELIKKGKAYVCALSGEEVSARRGTPQIPATSPDRGRAIDDSLRLFDEMRAGKHPNGSYTLRAKIDLASPNFNLRDPVLYRILHEEHHNTGAKWCIYPMYDWAHGFEDSLEGITHSVCTLEFENHRPLYDWFIDAVNEGRTADGSGPWGKTIHHPQQIEFARLNLTYTVMSKRFLLRLVEDKRVKGWDDPRLPTLAAYRRRGYPASAIRAFCDEVGVTRVETVIDVGRLENACREELNRTAPRAMAVLRPLKVVIENWPEGKTDELEFVVNPEDADGGKRMVQFGREIFIERDDFMEVPEAKFFRLAPGAEVRLRWAYFLKCERAIKNAAGEITELRCTIDPATRGGDVPPNADGTPGRKVKATLHWVNAADAVDAEVRLFDRLFTQLEPGQRTGELLDDLNENALTVVKAKVEPWLADAARRAMATFQFERLGYFVVDRESTPGALVFNRTVTLKDEWAAAQATKKGPVARMYSLAEAAHEFKVKPEKVGALLAGAGIAAFESRAETALTLEEVRAVKAWMKGGGKA